MAMRKTLIKEAIHAYNTYIKSGDYTEYELGSILGESYYMEYKCIDESIEHLNELYNQKHNWALKALKYLETQIKYAIYHNQISIDDLRIFENKYYNEDTLRNSLNSVDNMWDFYLVILKQLNFD